MPNHKSAEKRARQNEKRRQRNRGSRGKLRTGVKKLRAALEGGDKGAQALLPETVSLIDKAVQKGVLHRNAAARYKSRLAKRVGASWVLVAGILGMGGVAILSAQIAKILFLVFLVLFFSMGPRQLFYRLTRAFTPFSFSGPAPTRTQVTVVRP